MTAWIFFDCFNTLIDDFDAAGDESGLGSLPQLATELGACARPADFTSAYESLRSGGRSSQREVVFEARLLATLSSAGRLEHGEARAAVARLLERWQDEYPRSLRLTPGAGEMLAHWHVRRKLAVVSNFYQAGHPLAYLERFGVARYFEFVLDSATFGYRKPSPRIFQEALRRAGERAENVTFIGDRVDLDVAPALALGMRVIHLDRSSERPDVAPAPDGVRRIQSWDMFRESDGETDESARQV
jgi:HAD superfamily hydrolase (TIGR01509 family)